MLAWRKRKTERERIMRNTRNVAYWVTTGLVVLAFAGGGLYDLSGAPAVLEAMRQLGYPAYVAGILGVWKVLGAVAVAAPGLPRLKEWAYAGMLFDLSGAAVSHAASGDGVAKVAAPLVLLAVTFGSWALRPASRKLEAPASEARASEPAPVAHHAAVTA
jgi:uncharacterized membrane protein YphA (DoxX/SURF4 family)